MGLVQGEGSPGSIHRGHARGLAQRDQVRLLFNFFGRRAKTLLHRTGHTGLMKVIRNMGLSCEKGNGAKRLVLECQVRIHLIHFCVQSLTGARAQASACIPLNGSMSFIGLRGVDQLRTGLTNPRSGERSFHILPSRLSILPKGRYNKRG